MFRSLACMALLAMSAYAVDTDDISAAAGDALDNVESAIAGTMEDDTVGQTVAGMQCQVTTTALAIFNLAGLEAATPYEATVTGATDEKLQFNYCTFGTIPDDAYGYVVDTLDGSKNFAVADDRIDTIVDEIRDKKSKIIGVTFTQESDTVCTAADEAAGTEAVNYSMTTNVKCDDTITADGGATVESVTVDGCVYTVNLKHDAGCNMGVDTEIATQWLADNEWAIGILYLIIGPILALFGAAWFPYVTASLVAVFTIGLLCSLSLAAGWMATTVGTVVTFVVAIIVGVLVGMLVRRHVWIMVGLLGLIGGFFSGALVFALIAGMSGWTAAWGYWVISILLAAVGCVAACYMGKAIVITSTALVGSYLFMRSWTLFFPGHYPSEAQLMENPESLEFDAIFWVFVSIFIVTFIGTTVFQCKRDESHEDLDDYYSKAD